MTEMRRIDTAGAETDRTRLVNILLVDDDDGDAKGVIRAFKKARISNPIVRAVDGMQALEMLRGPDLPFARMR